MVGGWGRLRQLLKRWHSIKVWLTPNISGLFVARALNFLPDHSHAELRSTSEEEFMVVGTCISTLCDSSEAIQVELSLERSKLSLAKVFVHN